MCDSHRLGFRCVLFLQLHVFWAGPLAGGILAFPIYNIILATDTKSLTERVTVLKGAYYPEDDCVEKNDQKYSVELGEKF